MKLFDFLKVAQEKVDDLQKKNENDLSATLSNMIKKEPTQPKHSKPNLTAKKIISMFYADYPETPYISVDRKSDWIEMAELLPKTVVVQRQMMIRYADGLLPGHVYMLYWLKKNTNKKAPSYFEYKYGIDFEKEKDFLQKEGFLDNLNKPTAKGEKAIAKHGQVVVNHAQKTDLSFDAAYEDNDDYEAWLDHLDKGGATADWKKSKKKKK